MTLALLALPVLLAAPQAAPPSGAQHLHLQGEPRAAIREALQRGRVWLLARQAADGSFPPEGDGPACTVALTAMALWALAASEDLADPAGAGVAAGDRAARHLLAFRTEEGAIYDPERGLRVYTTGVAARALEAWCRRHPAPELEDAWRAAELFAFRRGVPESLVDLDHGGGSGEDLSAETARRLLDSELELAPAERRALEFLGRCASSEGDRLPARARRHGWGVPGSPEEPFAYEDVLPIVYASLRPEDDLARRAREAIRRLYTLERNPDLTQRYGPGGFQQDQQGYYYYLLLVGRTLAAYQRPTLTLTDGSERDWPRELSARLMALQRPDGAWSNAADRWWEGEPLLASSYALIALSLCAEIPAVP
jgi:squalene-hopene/tetraprenyl-beta-curcumene cyclase